MRFPYMGAARVKYLISILEHRRLVRQVTGWVGAPERASTRTAGDFIAEPIETRAQGDDLERFRTGPPREDAGEAVQAGRA